MSTIHANTNTQIFLPFQENSINFLWYDLTAWSDSLLLKMLNNGQIMQSFQKLHHTNTQPFLCFLCGLNKIGLLFALYKMSWNILCSRN
jgi:hypothetical protein